MTATYFSPSAIDEGKRPPEVRTPALPIICRHCSKAKVNRPRGLCWICYYTPGVKEMYGTPDPVYAKFARCGIAGANRSRPLPAVPTTAPPGSAEKLAVMHERARRGEQLFHPADSRGEGDRRPLVFLEALAS